MRKGKEYCRVRERGSGEGRVQKVGHRGLAPRGEAVAAHYVERHEAAHLGQLRHPVIRHLHPPRPPLQPSPS